MMNQTINIVIGGDLLPSDYNIEYFTEGNLEKLFDRHIVELFQKADFSICNLEGALTDSDNHIKKVDPIMKATPASINGISKMQIRCFSLANNHIVDYGLKGFQDTCNTLDKAGIDYFGAGINENAIENYYILNIKGKKIVFYAVAETMFNIPGKNKPGVNLYDEYRVCKEIEFLKRQCDYLIVLYHGGAEFFWYNSKELRKRFHRMADNGADVVISQHTHCIGIEEYYNNTYLLYGQGDFSFGTKANVFKATGLVLELDFGEKLQIKRHLIIHNKGYCQYPEDQNMAEFDARTHAFLEGNDFDKEFSDYADEMLIKFLEAFRGKDVIRRILKKILPYKLYKKYLYKLYTEKQILRIISGMQFEEFNEIAVRGLWNLVANE